MSGTVARALYRHLLKQAMRHAKEPSPGLIVRSLDGASSSKKVRVHKAGEKWWLPDLHERIPGLVPGSEPPEARFSSPAIAQCVRENFRARQSLARDSAGTGEALDTAFSALRFLRTQLRDGPEGTVSFDTDKGVEVEVACKMSEQGFHEYRLDYRVMILNSGSGKIRFQNAVLTWADGPLEANVGRVAARGRSPVLRPGDWLELKHFAMLPTGQGSVKGSVLLQTVRPGRQPRNEDCFVAAIGPLTCRAEP